MVRVAFSLEAVASFQGLPPEIRIRFDEILLEIGASGRLRLPGPYPVHPLEGSSNLWTLSVGGVRGNFRLDGRDVRFIRFASQGRVYQREPK